jgi:hypothetical protein
MGRYESVTATIFAFKSGFSGFTESPIQSATCLLIKASVSGVAVVSVFMDLSPDSQFQEAYGIFPISKNRAGDLTELSCIEPSAWPDLNG